MAVLSLVAMSCEKKVPTPEPVNFEITSDVEVNVGAEGGMVVITYTLGGGDYTLVQVSSDNESMVSAIDSDDAGIVRVMVTENTIYFEREAVVRIAYDGESKYVTIKQTAKTGSAEGYEVVNITANQLIGNYYGDTLVGGLGHYWIILSDGGIVDGELSPDGEFFRLDLLGPLAAGGEDVRIPDGAYTYTPENSLNSYTMLNLGSTDYVYCDDSGEWIGYAFTEAELIVEGDSFRLFARTEDKEFHVTFEGDYALTQNTISEYISTLKSDHEIDLTNCKGTLRSFGDYWECGLCNWQIEFVHNRGMEYGTYLVLDFLTDTNLSGASGVAGTYRSSGFTEEDPTKPAFASYTYVPGMRISDDGVFMMGSLLLIYEDGKGIDQAPIFDGEFTITENGDGTHTIVINALDDKQPAHKITLNWTGRLN